MGGEAHVLHEGCGVVGRVGRGKSVLEPEDEQDRRAEAVGHARHLGGGPEASPAASSVSARVFISATARSEQACGQSLVAVPSRSEASASSRSSEALNALLKRSSASPVTTQTLQAWVLRDDGARRAWSRIPLMSSGETGAGEYARMLRLPRMTLSDSIVVLSLDGRRIRTELTVKGRSRATAQRRRASPPAVDSPHSLPYRAHTICLNGRHVMKGPVLTGGVT